MNEPHDAEYTPEEYSEELRATTVLSTDDMFQHIMELGYDTIADYFTRPMPKSMQLIIENEKRTYEETGRYDEETPSAE